MPVYTLYADIGKEQNHAATPLDGDFKQVFPAEPEFHPVAKAVRLADGSLLFQRFAYQGVRVHPEHLPTKVEIGGPRSLTDLLQSNSLLLVSGRFRSVVEAVEPGHHQFVPVEVVWRDGTHAADFFWFYPCNRVDGMDRQETTHRLNEKSGLWTNVPGGAYVVNLDQVDDHHIWIDQKLSAFDLPFVSETFREHAESAELVGVGYHRIPTN